MPFSEGIHFPSVHHSLSLSCSACLASIGPAPRDSLLRRTDQSAQSFLHLQLELYAVSLKLCLSDYTVKIAADKNCPKSRTRDDKEQE